MATPALKAKELGNKAYKSKKFKEAIKHYDEAIVLDPTDITFYNNKGAVKFEQGEYDEVIKVCTKAVEIEAAKSVSDSKLIAKAQARLGKAYMKKDDLEKSMYHFDKAIFEHRAPEILRERSEVQKLLKERERVAYINPELSLEEKAKGNSQFKAGKYAEAIEFYTEAIKRNPSDHVLYSNRAACYTKLMEFGLGMQDCDKCIELAPDFIKGHLRKAALLRIEKPAEAKGCYERALAIDPNNAEARSGISNCYQSLKDLPPEQRAKQAMSDPEIQQILKDPSMQVILEQMQSDPSAANEHLKNPAVREKFSKLVESGIVSIR